MVLRGVDRRFTRKRYQTQQTPTLDTGYESNLKLTDQVNIWMSQLQVKGGGWLVGIATTVERKREKDRDRDTETERERENPGNLSTIICRVARTYCDWTCATGNFMDTYTDTQTHRHTHTHTYTHGCLLCTISVLRIRRYVKNKME